jgi:parvulin-like peptidyl-prolyl isomerase
MTDFNTLPFLSVGEQSISLGQAMQYLQRSSKLAPFVTEIVGQHLLLQELASRNDLEVSIAELEEKVQSFRNQENLTAPDSFQEWLTSKGLSYGAFHNLLTEAIKLEKLKIQLTEKSASEYFAQNHEILDLVKLTFIVVKNQEIADGFRQRMNAGTSFDEIVSECLNESFLKHSDQVVVKQGTLRRGQIPPELQESVKNSVWGQSIGPIEINQQWWLLKVDEIQAAQLDNTLKQQIETEFFKKWLVEKIQQSPVKLAGTLQ